MIVEEVGRKTPSENRDFMLPSQRERIIKNGLRLRCSSLVGGLVLELPF